MRREELGSLAMFLVVAEEHSFTRAAAKLGLSQSALSHSMRRLEARLGLRLLTRTTRSVAPTEAGERLIETLRPALDDIDQRLAALTRLRERPAGTVRITTSAHAARAVLWPVIDRLAAENPDINVEVNVEGGLVDIVAERYDAGIRLGERLEQDMVAVPISPKLRMAAFGAPSYFARRGTPQTLYDLAEHNCINLRLPTRGGLYAWEFDKDGREIRVRVEGQLIFNSVNLVLRAARAGLGLACVVDNHVHADIAAGTLVRALEDWCGPFAGYYLYFPGRRQVSPALSLLVEALRYRG
jgi:DNA-binding transcriptional LysR family regulator